MIGYGSDAHPTHPSDRRGRVAFVHAAHDGRQHLRIDGSGEGARVCVCERVQDLVL